MSRSATNLLVLPAFLASALILSAASPFVGNWGFNIPTPTGGNRAAWLGVTEKAGQLEVWFQPTGGNVFQVKDFKAEGSRLSWTMGKSVVQLVVAGGKLTGSMTRNDQTSPLNGFKEPALKRKAPKAWTRPEPLFNGKDLTGWEPMGDPSKSHWMVKDGLLVNDAHGANLKSARKFDDLKLHFEVNCPDHANSGFYLRGRYEVQLEYEPLTANPPERRIGSVYGRIAPKPEHPRTPGEWETFDVTLVGRTLTVVHNGVTTIDKQEIEGITGGALDANEGEPGPFYIQGDHTGGLKFRNITISVPRK